MTRRKPEPQQPVDADTDEGLVAEEEIEPGDLVIQLDADGVPFVYTQD